MRINKDTCVCISISSNPGNTGTKIQNALYDRHDLNFIYKSFKTSDVQGVMTGIKSLGIRGCSVSMPFKYRVIEYIDSISHSARQISAVNTIVNDNGFLMGYNTDIMGAERALSESNIQTDCAVIFGAGCTGRSVAYSLFSLGFKEIFVFNRTPFKSQDLSERICEMGVRCEPIHKIVGIEDALFVNCTSIGMGEKDIFPISDEDLRKFSLVFDVVCSNTELITRANKFKISTIAGIEMAINQSLFQFELYTGKKINFEEERSFIKEIL